MGEILLMPLFSRFYSIRLVICKGKNNKVRYLARLNIQHIVVIRLKLPSVRVD